MPSSPSFRSHEPLRYDRPAVEELRREIERALFPLPHFLWRFVRVERHGDEVLLRGVVESYYQKQLAQEYLRRNSDIGRIRNELVVWPRAVGG